MTLQIEDAAIERFLSGPAPHGSGEPSGFTTAREELAEALEGQAPRLSRLVFDRLGPGGELAVPVERLGDPGRQRARRHRSPASSGVQTHSTSSTTSVTSTTGTVMFGSGIVLVTSRVPVTTRSHTLSR